VAVRLELGDCLSVLRGLEPNSVDAVVTDPPYLLTSGKPRVGFDYCLRWIALQVQLPHFRNSDALTLEAFNFAPVPAETVDLRGVDGSGIDTGIGVPVGAVDLDGGVQVGQPEVNHEGEPAPIVTESPLPLIADAERIEPRGDLLFDLRDDAAPAFCKGACGCFRQFGPALFRVAVVVTGLPQGMGLFGTGLPSNTGSIGDGVGLHDDAPTGASGSAAVVAGSTTEVRAVLTLDLRRRTFHLAPADGAGDPRFVVTLASAERVGACPRARRLATEPEPNGVGTVVTSADRTGAPNRLLLSRHLLRFLASIVPQKGFMGKDWDGDPIAFTEDFWREVARVLKPGAHVVAFGGSRTYHLLASAIEAAGLEVRDQIQFLYGSGFPKSLDVSKAIDKAAGAEREVVGPGKRHNSRAFGSGEGDPDYGTFAGGIPALTAPATDLARHWDGWGTALKPAHEPIVLARKPLSEPTVAANVLKWGTGALNVDGCRVEVTDDAYARNCAGDRGHADNRKRDLAFKMGSGSASDVGRWPANLVLDEEAAALLDAQSGVSKSSGGVNNTGLRGQVYGDYSGKTIGSNAGGLGDIGGASRFFYTAKASRSERNAGLEDLPAVVSPVAVERHKLNYTKGDGEPVGRVPRQNDHPTVKPIALMRWLCRLITPPGGLICDPFMGSGTTGCAAALEGFQFLGIEQDAHYLSLSERRIRYWASRPRQLSLEGLPA
jgi:hypothetical protein